MSTLGPSTAWVRSDEEAPRLPPPPNMTGIAGWVGTNLFSELVQRPSDRCSSLLFVAWWSAT